jgi:hypothetical protein
MKKLRVKRYISRTNWSGYQLLQEKRWYGWKTIDREEIPGDVAIMFACFGDTGSWKSKFSEHIQISY